MPEISGDAYGTSTGPHALMPQEGKQGEQAALALSTAHGRPWHYTRFQHMAPGICQHITDSWHCIYTCAAVLCICSSTKDWQGIAQWPDTPLAATDQLISAGSDGLLP
jgi:hypothetical protein